MCNRGEHAGEVPANPQKHAKKRAVDIPLWSEGVPVVFPTRVIPGT